MTDLSMTIPDWNRIATELSTLQQSVTEQTLMQSVSQLSTDLQNLPSKLQSIRQRNYQYAADLEPMVAALVKHWQDSQDEMRYRAQIRSQRLNWDITDLQSITNRLNGSDSATWQTYNPRLQAEMTRLRNDIQTTHKSILQVAGTIPDQLKTVVGRLTQIEGIARHISEAGFSFNADESVYLAAGAEWKKGKNDKENPDGIFYVTNQRLIMEQNEKKGGMMGLGGTKVQQMLWTVPLTSVQGVFSENKGLFGNIDLVHIKLSDGVPAPEAIILIKDDYKADWFAAQIQRAQRGEIAQERVAKT